MAEIAGERSTDLAAQLTGHFDPADGAMPYRPVYGSTLTVESFTLWKHDSEGLATWGWAVEGLDETGSPALYRITTGAGDGDSCRADRSSDLAASFGDPEKWTSLEHPYTRAGHVWPGSARQGAWAPVQDWVDAIGIADAAGRRAHGTGPWAGHDLLSTLARIEHNIVAYDSAETRCPQSQRASPSALAGWLNDHLAATAVRVDVVALGRLPDDDNDVAFLKAWATDHPQTWLPYAVQSRMFGAWRNPSYESPSVPSPTVTVRSSGAQHLNVECDAVLRWSEISGYLEPVSAEATDAAWWVIHVRNTDVALVFPRAVMNVVIDTDADGSLVTLSAQNTKDRERYLRGRVSFEKEWGRWLFDDTLLTDRELATGVAQAEWLIHYLFTEEELTPPNEKPERAPDDHDDDDGRW